VATTPKGGGERQQKTTSLANNAPYCALKCHDSHPKGKQRTLLRLQVARKPHKGGHRAPAENHFAREQRTLLRPQVP